MGGEDKSSNQYKSNIRPLILLTTLSIYYHLPCYQYYNQYHRRQTIAMSFKNPDHRFLLACCLFSLLPSSQHSPLLTPDALLKILCLLLPYWPMTHLCVYLLCLHYLSLSLSLKKCFWKLKSPTHICPAQDPILETSYAVVVTSSEQFAVSLTPRYLILKFMSPALSLT